MGVAVAASVGLAGAGVWVGLSVAVGSVATGKLQAVKEAIKRAITAHVNNFFLFIRLLWLNSINAAQMVAFAPLEIFF